MDDELSQMYDEASDGEAAILDGLRIRAGLIWACPECGWHNPSTDAFCESCSGKPFRKRRRKVTMKITRKNQQSDVIYVTQNYPESGSVFITPDGEGRIWYDSIKEAQEQHGDDIPIIHCTVDPFEA